MTARTLARAEKLKQQREQQQDDPSSPWATSSIVNGEGDEDDDGVGEMKPKRKRVPSKKKKASEETMDDDATNTTESGAYAAPAKRARKSSKSTASASPAENDDGGEEAAVDMSASKPDQKGLRHFSILVCEKLEQLKQSTYKQIADMLVAEAAMEASLSGVDENEKNIRRRIYDALNVLMAMGIITKEKKSIRWKGFEVVGGPGYKAPGSNSALAAAADDDNKNLRWHREELKQVQTALTEKRASIAAKRARLEETTMQWVGMQALLKRNATASFQAQLTQNDEQKIEFPFLLLQTANDTRVECEMNEAKEVAIFTYSDPYSIHDYTLIQQHFGSRTLQPQGMDVDASLAAVKRNPTTATARVKRETMDTAADGHGESDEPFPSASTQPLESSLPPVRFQFNCSDIAQSPPSSNEGSPDADPFAALVSMASAAAASPKIKPVPSSAVKRIRTLPSSPTSADPNAVAITSSAFNMQAESSGTTSTMPSSIHSLLTPAPPLNLPVSSSDFRKAMPPELLSLLPSTSLLRTLPLVDDTTSDTKLEPSLIEEAKMQTSVVKAEPSTAAVPANSTVTVKQEATGADSAFTASSAK